MPGCLQRAVPLVDLYFFAFFLRVSSTALDMFAFQYILNLQSVPYIRVSSVVQFCKP